MRLGLALPAVLQPSGASASLPRARSPLGAAQARPPAPGPAGRSSAPPARAAKSSPAPSQPVAPPPPASATPAPSGSPGGRNRGEAGSQGSARAARRRAADHLRRRQRDDGAARRSRIGESRDDLQRCQRRSENRQLCDELEQGGRRALRSHVHRRSVAVVRPRNLRNARDRKEYARRYGRANDSVIGSIVNQIVSERSFERWSVAATPAVLRAMICSMKSCGA